MPYSLRRRRPTCFYCSSTSSEVLAPDARQWKCANCEAVNHLDQNGNYTDPPAASTPSSESSAKPGTFPRYARGVTHPSSAPPAPSTSFVFCATCLKNQHLIQQNLSTYLPPEDDARYASYLAGYADYKVRLDERYPPACADCAPKARALIEKSAYVAKTDHLRRMVEKTRDGAVSLRKDGRLWRGVGLRLAGLTWWLSSLGHGCWHGSEAWKSYSALRESDLPTPELWDCDPVACFTTALRERRLIHACVPDLTRWMPTILLAASLTLWWNSRLRAKYLQTGGRLLGLRDYYSLSLVLLVVRAGVWAFLTSADRAPMTIAATQGVHTFMALAMIGSPVLLSTLVKLDLEPRVSFHLREEHLPEIPPQNPNLQKASSRSQWANPPPITQFTLESFANPEPQRRVPAVHEEPELDDIAAADAMDWTPTPAPNAFKQPTRINQPSQVASQGPSPFRGTLPAAPLPPAHRLRRPAQYDHMAFRRATDSERDDFLATFNRPGTRDTDLDSVTTDADTLDAASTYAESTYAESVADEPLPSRADARRQSRSSRAASGRGKHDMRMRAPGFFASQDAVDTGLENLFDEVFTIRDEPVGVDGAARGNGGGSAQPSSGGVRARQEDPSRSRGGGDANGSGSSFVAWTTILLVGAVPACIIGGVTALVKGGWDWR